MWYSVQDHSFPLDKILLVTNGDGASLGFIILDLYDIEEWDYKKEDEVTSALCVTKT